MPDLHYDPEKFGLRTLGKMSWTDAVYSFDLTVVWRDADGRFYVGSDAGCSCPSPFQDKGVGDLVRFATPQDALASIQARLDGITYDEWSEHEREYVNGQFVALAELVMRDEVPA